MTEESRLGNFEAGETTAPAAVPAEALAPAAASAEPKPAFDETLDAFAAKDPVPFGTAKALDPFGAPDPVSQGVGSGPVVDFDDDKYIFIPEVHRQRDRLKKFLQFTRSTTRAAGIMLAAAIIALIVANSGAYEAFTAFFETHVGLVFGGTEITMSLVEIINDILMAIFFLLVGLDIKYEMTVGELTNIRQAILPVAAACGGVLAPIVIYSIVNLGSPATAGGWGVPTATDIAFALGIMALLGNRVPSGVRVFLSTLAVADDIIAIIIIAVFYGQAPSFVWLGLALVVVLALVCLNRMHVFSLAPYLLIGCVLWYCVFMSGVHSTIAGVLLAFTIPSGSRVNLRDFVAWQSHKVERAGERFNENEPVIGQKDFMSTAHRISFVAKEAIPPATRLEHALFPWVYFVILPLFALTNADVCFTGGDMATLFSNPAMFGSLFGLLFGKPIGIVLVSFVIIKLKIASLPSNCTWTHMLGAGILGGVGFTMAIFVANLAFTDPANVVAAKVGILSASLVASIAGFIFLSIEAARDKRRGIVYLATKGDEAFAPSIDAEVTDETAEMLDSIDDPSVRAQVEAALQAGSGVAEVAVNLGAEEKDET